MTDEIESIDAIESVRIVPRPPAEPVVPAPTDGFADDALADDAPTTELARVGALDDTDDTDEADLVDRADTDPTHTIDPTHVDPTDQTGEIPVIDAFAGSTDTATDTATDTTTDTAEPEAPRKVIIIDGDNPVDRTGLDGSTDTPVDPRIRARRRKVRRAAARRRLRWVIVGVAVLAIIGGIGAVFASPIVSVRHVRVTGNSHTNSEMLGRVVVHLQGEPMARADLGFARTEIAADPWVKRVSVRREWPSTILIDMAERTPIAAFLGVDQLWHVYDTDGRVLETVPDRPADLVAVTPAGTTDPTPIGEQVSAPLADAGRLAMALPKRLRDRTTTITVGGDGIMRLDLKGNASVYFGTISEMREKLVSILTVIDTCAGAPFTSLNVAAPRDLVIAPPGACATKPLTGKSP
jgi:cell division protein FtsQ